MGEWGKERGAGSGAGSSCRMALAMASALVVLASLCRHLASCIGSSAARGDGSPRRRHGLVQVDSIAAAPTSKWWQLALQKCSRFCVNASSIITTTQAGGTF